MIADGPYFGIGSKIIMPHSLLSFLPTYLLHDTCCHIRTLQGYKSIPVCTGHTGDIYRAGVFSSGACRCSVSTVINPIPLTNLYLLQPVATDH